jgi:hypothetical protein
MGLGQVFVLTDKEKDVIPIILVKVDPQAITDTFGFANVNSGFSEFRICPTQEIHARFSSLVSREHSIEFAARTCHGFSRPI